MPEPAQGFHGYEAAVIYRIDRLEIYLKKILLYSNIKELFYFLIVPEAVHSLAVTLYHVYTS